MNVLEKIKKDHKKKSDVVRKLKKKLKKSIPVSVIEEMIRFEKEHEVSYYDYYDDDIYGREITKQEGRIQALEGLLKRKKKRKEIEQLKQKLNEVEKKGE